MTEYPVHEVFHTFQGEGVHMGLPAFFIRLYGCPVHCPWCDSAGTWHKDWVPEHVKKKTANVLADMAEDSGVEIVVITGGEPAVYDLTELMERINRNGMLAHLETSGAFQVQGMPDWITLSPKKWKLPLAETMRRADEFKIIVEQPEDIVFYENVIKAEREFKRPPIVWLHPEWSQRDNPAVLIAISEAVKNGNGVYRAGWQLHKLYRVDALDERSQPLVPLGGDTKKGF